LFCAAEKDELSVGELQARLHTVSALQTWMTPLGLTSMACWAIQTLPLRLNGGLQHGQRLTAGTPEGGRDLGILASATPWICHREQQIVLYRD
jgi:hypothetical protein